MACPAAGCGERQRELDTTCRLFAEIDEHGVMSLATPSPKRSCCSGWRIRNRPLRVFEMRTQRPDAWQVDMALIEALAARWTGKTAQRLSPLRRGFVGGRPH